jgi:hypothetical protein
MNHRRKRTIQALAVAGGAAVAGVSGTSPAEALTARPRFIEALPFEDFRAVPYDDVRVVPAHDLTHDVSKLHLEIGCCLTCGLGGWDPEIYMSPPWELVTDTGRPVEQVDLGGIGPDRLLDQLGGAR